MSNAAHLEQHVPSAWVCRFAPLIRAGGNVLDVACGGGRHARYLAGLGLRVEAVDRDPEALRQLAGVAGVITRSADLENAPWPYAGRQFDAIVVTNYLHRPLFPQLRAALAAGGVLIYETFAVGNERYGPPSNPDFLLKPAELLELAHGRLRVVAYEDLYLEAPTSDGATSVCYRRVTNKILVCCSKETKIPVYWNSFPFLQPFCSLYVLMSMNSEDANNPPPPQYAEEVLCANWNPLALMLAEPLAQAQKSVLDGIDVETFLARLYLCQQA